MSDQFTVKFPLTPEVERALALASCDTIDRDFSDCPCTTISQNGLQAKCSARARRTVEALQRGAGGEGGAILGRLATWWRERG